MIIRALVPQQVQVQELKIEFEQIYHEWRSARADKFEQFEPINISFVHDPNWNKRFWSIQNAHDGNSYFWKATKVFMGAAFGAW